MNGGVESLNGWNKLCCITPVWIFLVEQVLLSFATMRRGNFEQLKRDTLVWLFLVEWVPFFWNRGEEGKFEQLKTILVWLCFSRTSTILRVWMKEVESLKGWNRLCWIVPVWFCLVEYVLFWFCNGEGKIWMAKISTILKVWMKEVESLNGWNRLCCITPVWICLVE